MVALALLCLGLSSCGTAAPVATPPAAPAPALVATPAPAAPVAPVFADAAAARSALVGSLVTVAPAKIIADLDALSHRLGLPMMFGQQLLAALSGMSLLGDQAHFQAIWERLDPAAPFAVVWVLPPKSEVKGFCAALSFRDGAGAQQTFEEMGVAGEQKSGVASRRTPEGDILWGSVRGRTLFLSGSPEALLLSARLAEATQVAPQTGQIVLTALPPAIVAATGKSRNALLAELAASTAQEMKTARGFGTLASQRYAAAFIEAAAALALDSSAIRVAIEVGPNDGLLVQSEMVPATGTGFAAGIARRAPYAFDSKLPVRDDSTAVSAIGSISAWLGPVAKLFTVTGPAGQGLQQAMDRYFSMTGEWSCSLDTVEVGMMGLCSASLKEGVRPKAMLDAIVALLEAEQAWEAELYARKLSPLKIRRSRDMVEIEKKLEQPDRQARAMAQALAGGEVMKTAFKVKNGRLLLATGKDARRLLGRHGTGGDLKKAPLVSAGLTRSKGAEAMMSLDVVAMLLRMMGKAKDIGPAAAIVAAATAMPGLAEMKAPFLFIVRGGNSLTGELRIPLGSLENVAKVVRGMFEQPR
jgi:hypothetical protein